MKEPEAPGEKRWVSLTNFVTYALLGMMKEGGLL
jgi:hypothetical protein